MRDKQGLLALIIGVCLLFCLTTSSFSESTLVEGNSDLIVFTYTKYLDGKPVLIFSEQVSEKLSNLLNKVDNIVFCDSTRQDLALKLIKGKSEAEVWQRMKSSEPEIAYIFTKDGEFYVPETIKNYELKVKLKPKAVESRVYIRPKILSDTSLLDSGAQHMPHEDFPDIILQGTPVLFTKDIEADLEEFPAFKLEAEFENKGSSKLLIYLGIDYTGDNIIDSCLKFEDVSVCEYNIFELAKTKWKKFNKFVLKEICFQILPEDKKKNEKEKAEAGIFRIKDISLFNENSLAVVEKKYQRAQLKFQEVNAKSSIIEKDDTINISVCVEDEPVEKDHKKKRTGKIKIQVPLEIRNFHYFSFNYELEDPEFQDIKLAISINKENKRRTIGIPASRYTKLRETQKIEVNLKRIIPKGYEVEDLIIILEQKELDENVSRKNKWRRFQLANLQLYEKFPYSLKTEQGKENFLSLLSIVNPPLVKIDNQIFHLNDFVSWKNFKDLENNILLKKFAFSVGEHKYEKFENETLDVEWVIIEPEGGGQRTEGRNGPEITFKKINPVKYLVKVKGAKSAFWMVFSESFHKQWKLYKIKNQKSKIKNLFDEIVADYPELGVKEAKKLVKFIPQDINFLFEKPLEASHQLVNTYANGWYIEPRKLGLGEDFVLTIYFWPQSLFYLGLGISGLTLLCCLIYLTYRCFPFSVKRRGRR
ncbi:hypothetical protein KKC91_03405 [bacterium]|nr:hypothetical protein [bacterium]